MLRVEILDSTDTVCIKLEGRFAGNDAEQTRLLVWPLAAAIERRADKMLHVDLAEVTFIDIAGEEALSLLGRLGAQFIATTSYALDVCERLRLPVAHTDGTRASTSRTSSGNNDQTPPGELGPQEKKL
jgi:predicted HAD superfamily phosphohydrolase